MQFSVPQFIEVEDKIFGPLTLKQFLVLLFGGLVVFLWWSLFKTSAIFFLLLIPTAVIFGWLAMGKFNGRSVLSGFPVILQFFLKPRYRIFRRTGESTLVVSKTEEPKNRRTEEPLSLQERSSRLHRLAYLLDQKTAEEERLIHSGEDNMDFSSGH